MAFRLVKVRLTLRRLRQLLSYDQTTGIFTWRKARRGCRVGDQPGYVCAVDGYRRIEIDGYGYLCHRLAWLYVTGRWPKNQIDHKDGIRANNKFGNLRDVIQDLNCQNLRGPQKNNTTGFLGVSFDKERGLYQTGIGINGKRKALGRYATAQEAHDVYMAAKRELHPGNML